MSEYIPTTEQIYEWYVPVPDETRWYGQELLEKSRAEFDRWLASVKADAWEEGMVACAVDEGYDMVYEVGQVTKENPYRGEQA